MKLAELYLKFQTTGKDQVITDAELKELQDKLTEVQDLFRVWNPLIFPIALKIESVEDMLRAREWRGKSY